MRRLSRRPQWQRWLALLVISALLVGGLEMAHLSAALLLGSMAAAIVLAVAGASVRVPAPAFVLAQGVIGAMIARNIPASIVGEIISDGPLFFGCVLAVVAVAVPLGLLLQRWRLLPGTTALWGTFPGGASAMVLMSASFGGDMRLVAFMQYLRVVLVAVVASVMARLWQIPGHDAQVAALSTAGRSERSRARAQAAGMCEVAPEMLLQAEYFLSVVPPSDALGLARQFAQWCGRSEHRPMYIDLYAINPDTVSQVQAVVTAAGAVFVDGCIIGFPPVGDDVGPTVYCPVHPTRLPNC